MAAVVVAVALLGVALMASDTPSQATPEDARVDREGRLQGRVGAIVASERSRGFSGAVLVVRRGRPVFARGVGLADRGKRIRISRRTVFDIGSPSWLFLTIDPRHREAVNTGELVTRDGRKIDIPALRLDERGTWGGAIPVRLYEVKSVRLLGDSPGEVLQASFPG
jgi:hypothetical protein